MANNCIKSDYFRYVNKDGNVIVEAIEKLQQDVERIDGDILEINGNIQQIMNTDIPGLRADLMNLDNEMHAAMRTLEERVDVLASGDYTFVKWHGAKGDGVTDDTEAIQAALDSGKTYIIFDKGEYLVSSAGYGYACLLVDSNKHLLGNAATIINNTPSSISIVNKSPALEDETAGGAYTANHNITIEGLNFKGDNNISVGCLGFAHCENIKILNCNFKDIGGWHFIELNSTRNSIISGCTFSNYVGANLTEMIQLDMATHADVFPFFGPYDRTNTNHILIENCIFSNPVDYYSDSSHYFSITPAAIGNHNASATAGENVNHVTISNCLFDNMNTCVKFSALRNSTICNNQALAVRHFFNASNMTSESIDYFAGIKINGNRMITDPLPASVITTAQSTVTRCIGFYGRNCEVSNNDIYGWSGYAICLGGPGHIISDNAVTACGRKAIYVFGCDNNILEGNKCIANCTYGMSGDADIVVVPDSESSPADNTLISGNLVDTAILNNIGATKTAFVNNNVKTSVTKGASDTTVYHANVVNGSWVS